MDTIYKDEFTCKKDIAEEFQIEESQLEGCNILMACYTYEDYEGYAMVVFEKDGDLYEVHGAHCSCYGLEDQWKPEKTTIEAIKMQKVARFASELAQMIASYEAAQ